MGGAQRHGLTDAQRCGGLGERQRRHGDRLEGDRSRPLVGGPVPHVQVDGRRVTPDAGQSILQRNVEVAVNQPILPAFGRVDLGAAFDDGTISGGRETDGRYGRGVGDVEGERALITIATDRHVRDDGGLGVQREAVADLLG